MNRGSRGWVEPGAGGIFIWVDVVGPDVRLVTPVLAVGGVSEYGVGCSPETSVSGAPG